MAKTLRWWIAFIAGTLVLNFTGDMQQAKHVYETLLQEKKKINSGNGVISHG